MTHIKHHRDIAKDSVICSFFPQKKNLKIYEASAGKGELAYELSQLGHDLTVSSLGGGALKFGGLVADAVNLEKNLPYGDSVFDVIICREVVEHIDSVYRLFGEFNRVLKPGGVLVLTFPNKISLRSRFYHLLTGFCYGMKSPINLDVPFGEAHVNLKSYPEIDYLLRKQGLAVENVGSSYLPKSMYAFAFLHPFVLLFTYFFLLSHKKKAREHRKDRQCDVEYNRFIIDKITSRALLYGKDVILSARKGGSL
ncbi:MAG: class I SAM-dependent methyltransferase [Desulfovibrio sp.]